jgi:hypothetical protein
MRECLSCDFYRAVLLAGRDLSSEVAAFLQTGAESLRSSADDTDEATAFAMICHGHSAQHQRLLLGPEFFTWLAQASPHRIVMIQHSYALSGAADHFLVAIKEQKYGQLDRWIAGLSPQLVRLLGTIVAHIGAHAKECGIRITGQTLLPLFEAIMASEDLAIAALMQPIAAILASTAIIQNYDDTQFLRGLLNGLAKLCGGIKGSATGLYQLRIRTLNVFAQNERCCLTMSQVPDFNLAVVSHLSDNEPSVFELNWMFFQSFTKYSKVLGEFFKKVNNESSPAAQALAALVDTTSSPLLKKWIQFSMGILQPPPGREPIPPPVVAAWCDALGEKLSRIAIIITTRQLLFKDDDRMIQLLEEYLTVILNIEVAGTQDFVGKIQEHLLSMEKQKEVKGRRTATLSRKQLSLYLQQSIVPGDGK